MSCPPGPLHTLSVSVSLFITLSFTHTNTCTHTYTQGSLDFIHSGSRLKDGGSGSFHTLKSGLRNPITSHPLHPLSQSHHRIQGREQKFYRLMLTAIVCTGGMDRIVKSSSEASYHTNARQTPLIL